MARAGRGKSGRGSRRPRRGGDGFNPYRSGDGKFKSGPHKKRIAKERSRESRLRSESLKAKRQMTALKRKATLAKAPAEKARLKKQFVALQKKRERLRVKADAATQKRRLATADMKTARERHRAEAKSKRQAKRKSKKQPEQPKKQKTDAGEPKREESKKAPDPHAHTRISGKTDSHSKTDRRLAEAEDAFGRRDFITGRKRLESVADEYGFEKQMRDTNEIVAVHIPAVEGAHAYHDWNGRIRLSEETASSLETHGKYAGAERAGETGINQSRRAYDKHMRIAVHEVLHGYGPTYAHDYWGTGAKIEEITTEVAARKIVSDHYGLSRHTGSYDQPIHNAIAVVMHHRSMTFDDAHVELERISLAFKRERRGVGAPMDVFVKHLGQGALHRIQIDEMLNYEPGANP